MLPKQRLRRAWFDLQNRLPRVNRYKLCVAVPIFFLLCTFAVWTLSSDNLRERSWFGSVLRSNFKLHRVPELDSRFQPESEVAWAIPVGGRCAVCTTSSIANRWLCAEHVAQRACGTS